MNNIKKRLGRRIQELRKSNKLTQEQLAEKIEIGTSNISYIETGKFYPTPETLGKIAKALNVEIYELYMFEQLKPIDELRTELIGAIRANDDLTRLMYKFYLRALNNLFTDNRRNLFNLFIKKIILPGI